MLQLKKHLIILNDLKARNWYTATGGQTLSVLILIVLSRRLRSVWGTHVGRAGRGAYGPDQRRPRASMIP